MKRVRAWLRAFGPVRLLDDCAALMVMESGSEAESDVRRALEARPPLVQRAALRLVLRTIRRQTARTAQLSLCPDPAETAPEDTEPAIRPVRADRAMP